MDEIKEEIEKKDEQETVMVYVMVSGDYCAFHEITLRVVYDLTNDHPVGNLGYTKEQLDEWDYTDYSDVAEFKAIRIGKEYFVRL